MKAFQLHSIDGLYFSTLDIARTLGISQESARVAASRYTKQNVLVRIKRDMYILPSRISGITDSERFILANIAQTPSYVSLTTALGYYGLSTQVQQNYIESIALKRTKTISTDGLTFTYILIKEKLYDGFELRNDFFIATPEKALADAVYLTSLGRYSCDFYAIDFFRLDKRKISEYIRNTNRVTKLFWNKLCKNFKI